MKQHQAEYNAVITLINVTCHYCGRVVQVNPNDPSQAGLLANILKVQRADGSTFAFCDHECLRSGTRYFGRHPMVPVEAAQGTGFAETSSNVIVTDPEEVRPVAVEEHEQISLERLQEIAFGIEGNQEGAD